MPAIATRAAKTAAAGREQGRGAGGGSSGGGGGGAQAAESGEDALRKLSLEVAELRTMLVINRSALARVETMGRPAEAAAGAAAPEGAGGAAAAATGGEANRGEERRDNAVRKLTRDVAELRTELSAVADMLSGGATPGGRGGDTEVVQTMKREMLELRSQLENVRKEAALTRSAVRRLQGDVDSLEKGAARPTKRK